MVVDTRPQTIADGLAASLLAGGVRHLFGMPGGGANTDLVEAAGRAGLEFVLCHTETAAGFAASAYAELTAGPGAFLTTLGPGVASACNAVAHCWLDRDPVLLISDCHPRAVDGLEHQRFDHAAVLAPITKRSASLADEPAGVINGLLRTAQDGQPGPVHLDVAPDITPKAFLDAGQGSPHLASPTAVGEECSALLRKARKPVILAGLGVRGQAAAQALRELAERLQAPVLVTYKGKGAFPDQHPLHAGIVTGGTLEQPLLAEADLIVGAGFDPVELIPRRWPYTAPVLYLGAWPHNEQHFPATCVIGDLAASLRALPGRPGEWDVQALADGKRKRLERLRLSSDALAPHRLVEIARELTPGDPVVSVDAGAHMFAATNFWQTGRPNGFLISNGLASMGYALPAAVAAAVLHPDETVIAFTGDGGLCMCLGELETIARQGLKVVVAVFDDSTLSLIKIKQDQKGFAPSGVRFAGIDWRKLAEGLGCGVVVADNESSFRDAWRQAMNANGPVLVDARVDASAYGAMLAALRS